MVLQRFRGWLNRRNFLNLDINVLFLIVLIVNTMLAAVTKGEVTIVCSCSTSDCVLAGRAECTTLHMCFTQYLERSGAPVVTRGCIDTPMSLLCENMRPATRGRHWPMLHCCRQDLCNVESGGGVSSVRPTARHQPNDTSGSAQSISGVADFTSAVRRHPASSNATSGRHDDDHVTDSSGGGGVSITVTVSVAAVGVAALALLCLVAARVLRRQHRPPSYARHRSCAYEKGESFVAPPSAVSMQMPSTVMPAPAYCSPGPPPPYVERAGYDQTAA